MSIYSFWKPSSYTNLNSLYKLPKYYCYINEIQRKKIHSSRKKFSSFSHLKKNCEKRQSDRSTKTRALMLFLETLCAPREGGKVFFAWSASKILNLSRSYNFSSFRGVCDPTPDQFIIFSSHCGWHYVKIMTWYIFFIFLYFI